MGKKCKIPHCHIKTKEEKLSIFTVPKNTEQRQKWSEILGCTLNENSYICEKHFLPADIKSSFTAKTENGVVIYSVSITK